MWCIGLCRSADFDIETKRTPLTLNGGYTDIPPLELAQPPRDIKTKSAATISDMGFRDLIKPLEQISFVFYANPNSGILAQESVC